MSDADQVEHLRDDAPVTNSKVAQADRTLFTEAVTINRPAGELYEVWRSLRSLALFMDNVEDIIVLDEVRSRWRVKAPGGQFVEWESIITDDVPGQSITWQSADGAEIKNSGRVEFQDAGARGTVVHATIAYSPPGGRVGELLAKLFKREPRLQTRRDLHRFKQLMETGEISTNARTRSMRAEERGN